MDAFQARKIRIDSEHRAATARAARESRKYAEPTSAPDTFPVAWTKPDTTDADSLRAKLRRSGF